MDSRLHGNDKDSVADYSRSMAFLVFSLLFASFAPYSCIQSSSFPLVIEHSRYSEISMMQALIAFPVGVFSYWERPPEKSPMCPPKLSPPEEEVPSTVLASTISPVVASITFRST